MAGSLDKVLQPDGTYKWEVVEHKKEADEAPVVSSASEPKVTKKKTTKKKTTNPLSE